MKYLRDLLDMAACFSFKRQIVREMWTEVSGNAWHETRYRNLPRMIYHPIKIGWARKLPRTPRINKKAESMGW